MNKKEQEALWCLNNNSPSDVTFSRGIREYIMKKTIKQAKRELSDDIEKHKCFALGFKTIHNKEWIDIKKKHKVV